VSRLALGVLASGTGTNFDAIAEAIADGRVDAQVRVVVCNRPGAAVLDKARARGIEVKIVEPGQYDGREAFDRAVAEVLVAAGAELVVMAGFDRLVTRTLLSRFPSRVVNIHPALLPAFKGLDAQAQAAGYGVTIAGATVHLVDEHMDHGPIIVQAAVPIVPGESAEAVGRRILEQEHRIYPWAIQLFAEGRVRVSGRIVTIDGVSAAARECLVSPPIPG
jgi:phosphoribosylglycinamide formyltransferase-1